ncbi:MAG: fluoride efflux transporter FluC [Candidatus Methanofastidiosia archaeon]
MYPLLLVGLGGSIGAIFRYCIYQLLPRDLHILPIATVIVNVVGSFLFGFVLFSSMYKGDMSEETFTFLCVGILGAFTTMSTFSYESFALFEQGKFLAVGTNIIGTVVATLCAVYAGKITAIMLYNT